MGKREFIARNVAAMFHDGDVVNLGVGIPTLASTYVPGGHDSAVPRGKRLRGCGRSRWFSRGISRRARV